VVLLVADTLVEDSPVVVPAVVAQELGKQYT
jgi:hypothetical protein